MSTARKRDEATAFAYQDMFPLGPDPVTYRQISTKGISTLDAAGRRFLRVDAEAIRTLTREAIGDISHLFRASHLQQLRNIIDEANRMAVRSTDVLLMYLPLFHAFGLYEGPLMSVVTGARQVLMEQFDPGEALRLIASEKATMIHGFDTHFHDLMAHPDCQHTDRSSLRTGLLAAGLSSTEPVARQAQQRLCRTVSGWGMTEVGVGAALGFLDDTVDDRCLASGAALPGYEFKIIDPGTGTVRPPGTPGELCCRGYGVMQGYYKKPEETARAIDAQGWLHSGDLGYVDDDGFLYLVDRKKDMIDSGGVKVYPRDIEEVAARHPAVREVAVFGIPDPKWGETPVAAVVLRAGATATAEELLAFLNANVAAQYQRVARVLIYDDFPRNAAGKTLKREMRAKFWEKRDTNL